MGQIRTVHDRRATRFDHKPRSDRCRKASHRGRKAIGDRPKKIKIAALLACGELCRGCGQQCSDKPTETNTIEIEDDSDPMQTWRLTECPRAFTRDIVEAVNAAQLAETHLPVAGGTLDQSAWWIEAWMALKRNINRIEYDQAERQRNRGRR